MLIKHERDQKRIAELKAQVAARKEEIARKDALKKELESQLSSKKAEIARLEKRRRKQF